MAEMLIDGTGSGNMARINSEGRLLVDLGGDVIISGVTIDSVVLQEVSPTDETQNNPAYTIDYSGAGVVSVIHQFIDSAEFTQTVTVSGPLDVVTNIGSWIGV